MAACRLAQLPLQHLPRARSALLLGIVLFLAACSADADPAPDSPLPTPTPVLTEFRGQSLVAGGPDFAVGYDASVWEYTPYDPTYGVPALAQTEFAPCTLLVGLVEGVPTRPRGYLTLADKPWAVTEKRLPVHMIAYTLETDGGHYSFTLLTRGAYSFGAKRSCQQWGAPPGAPRPAAGSPLSMGGAAPPHTGEEMAHPPQTHQMPAAPPSTPAACLIMRAGGQPQPGPRRYGIRQGLEYLSDSDEEHGGSSPPYYVHPAPAPISPPISVPNSPTHARSSTPALPSQALFQGGSLARPPPSDA